MNGERDLTVAIARDAPVYPTVAPFDPDTAYPEYRGGAVSADKNAPYAAVRRSFELLGLDAAHFGTAAWNPLRDVVRPGDRVFVKPNLVTHEYRRGCGCEGDLFSVITHPSVVRAVADYVAIALDGRGEIVIGDNPCIDADFALLAERTSLRSFEQVYRERFGVRCRVLDLRPKITRDLTYYGFGSKTELQDGDPDGEIILDLGDDSFFSGINPFLFRGVFGKRWETIRHHVGHRHEYSLSRTIVESDVFISVPKLKAHHKVGATLNVKGLVGINYNKNFLVHWRIGYPGVGGDEYPEAHRRGDAARLFVRHAAMDVLPEPLYLALRGRFKGSKIDRWLTPTRRSEHERYRGAWDGNDTCWRMAADLYELFVADVKQHRTRLGLAPMRFFSVVDGVVAGEGNGPFCPTAKPTGVVLAGRDLLATDFVAARLMDFRPEALRYLVALGARHGVASSDITVRSPDFAADSFFDESSRHLELAPPTGWPRLSMARAGVRSPDTEYARGTP